MKVNFYATLRRVTGQNSVEFDLPGGTTVDGLLAAVVERYPELRKELFNDDGTLLSNVHIFINGRDAPYLDRQLATVLQESDTVDVFPAVGGG
jgi:molybdopterin synthase sulfur carrier subunit